MTEIRGFKDRYWLHITLFLLTLISTIWAGSMMADRQLVYLAADPWFSLGGFRVSAPLFWDGLRFGGSLLLFLTVHEFGHYFAARIHRVSVSLPYYIPFPFNGIGTFGAVIRIRQQIPSMRKLFDIGAAGPLAGFVIALVVLLIGFATLPDLDYVQGFAGHEALKDFIQSNDAFPGAPFPSDSGGETVNLIVGTTPLYWMLSQFFSDVPPMWEMYHYPVLFAGWLGLFFTALNLLPVGQLDGGHILFALLGPRRHAFMAKTFVMILLLSGGIGFVDEVKPVLEYYDPALGQLIWIILSSIFFLYTLKIFKGEFKKIIPAVFSLVVLTSVSSLSEVVVSGFGYSGWLVWCLLIILLIRVEHPPVHFTEPLSRKRKTLAILSLLIFALCFSFKPLYIG